MRLGYAILYVPDVAATLAFYTRAFGIERRFIDDANTYGELDTGATVLAFASEALAATHGADIRPTRPGEAAPAFEVAFVTDDVDAAMATALAAGAERVADPAKKPWGQIVAYVRDCNGALVELCTPVG